MRIGFQILIFLIILNLVTTLVVALGIPGTEYTQVGYSGTSANATTYTTEFNATTLLDRWTATPFSGVPVFGDIFSGIYLMYNAVRAVIFGFPDLIASYAYAIPDATTRNVLYNPSGLDVADILFAVVSVVIFLWLFQLITGRRISE